MQSRKTILENGVRLVSEPLEHVRSVSLGIWVQTGSRDEPRELNGVSHFIEHMAFKGTRNRSGYQIAKELDAIGGMNNAFTTKESTCFYAKVLDTHWPILAEILSDIFLYPLFDPEDVGREKQVILQEIRMVEDTPDDHLLVLFENAFWGDHPIGMPVLGTGPTVLALERETALTHMEKTYLPQRIVIAAAGRVEHEALVEFFGPVFSNLSLEVGSLPQGPPPKARSSMRVFPKELEQIHLCVGGEAPSLTSPKRFASILLNTILGGNMSSRLFQEIRERLGLAYAVHSFGCSYLDTGLLGVYVATDRERVGEVLEVVGRELRKIREGEISTSDLKAAQEHLIGGLYLSSEGTESRMMRLAKNELVYGRYVPHEEVVASLQAVQADEVIQVANEVFGPGRVSMAALGPVDEGDLEGGLGYLV